MPVVDMPLEKLRQYRGKNPKPKDFDLFWDRAIQELDRTSFDVRFILSDFQTRSATCYDLFFTGVKGGRVHAKFLVPKDLPDTKIPAVLTFHGYRGRSGDWSSYLGLCGLGYAVAAMDVRGQAGKSEDRNPVRGTTNSGHIIRGLSDDDPENLFFRQVFLDTAELARIVLGLDYIDRQRVYTTGGSQGGALALACSALEPNIKKVCVKHPFLADYRRVWEMDLTQKGKAYEELRVYFRDFDPLHEREQEIFEKLGYIDIQFLAERVKAAVLMATGLMDDVCPPSTQFAVYNRIVSPKRHLIYPDFGHESFPGYDDIRTRFFEGTLEALPRTEQSAEWDR